MDPFLSTCLWWVEEALSNFSLSDYALKVRKPLAFKASTPNRETNQKPGAREVRSISPSLALSIPRSLCFCQTLQSLRSFYFGEVSLHNLCSTDSPTESRGLRLPHVSHHR